MLFAWSNKTNLGKLTGARTTRTLFPRTSWSNRSRLSNYTCFKARFGRYMLQPEPAVPSETSIPTYGALDLGSNSFHLIVAGESGGRLKVLDKHREAVRLARGLDATDRISQESIKTALSALRRMAERIKNVQRSHLRVVGTNTLRKAENSEAFIRQAEDVLGHRIEIIGGREEARLIFLGVSHSIENRHSRRIVIDIGGGSTELILGQHFQPRFMESLDIGCVSITDRWFSSGLIKLNRFNNAINDAGSEIETVEHPFTKHRWDVAIGASGTILAAQQAMSKQLGMPVVTLEGLMHVKREMLQAGHVRELPASLASADRAAVFPGGIAILIALFERLQIEEMSVSDSALREGIVHDILGRVQDQDIREKSVVELMARYHVDEVHAERVAHTAILLLDQVSSSWDVGDEEDRAHLRWAGMLHEIGLDISHASYHKHGAYLLEHLDIPGFSREEQKRVGTLVRHHRRKLPSGAMRYDLRLLKLALLLRLAVLLHRNRSDYQSPPVALTAGSNGLVASFSRNWLRSHPLTKLDLDNEVATLNGGSLTLSVSLHR